MHAPGEIFSRSPSHAIAGEGFCKPLEENRPVGHLICKSDLRGRGHGSVVPAHRAGSTARYGTRKGHRMGSDRSGGMIGRIVQTASVLFVLALLSVFAVAGGG